MTVSCTLAPIIKLEFYVTLRNITITLRNIALPFVTLQYITLLRYVTIHYVSLRYISLYYVTLHCVTFRYVTLRYITLKLSASAKRKRASFVGLWTGSRLHICAKAINTLLAGPK